jgi:hypothetical protein
MKRNRTLAVLRWLIAFLCFTFASFALVGTPVVINMLCGEPLYTHDDPRMCSGMAMVEYVVCLPAYFFSLLGLPIAFALVTRRRWVRSLIQIDALGLTLTFVLQTVLQWNNVLHLWDAWDVRVLFFSTTAMLTLSQVTWPVCLWLTSFILQQEEEIQQATPPYSEPAERAPQG